MLLLAFLAAQEIMDINKFIYELENSWKEPNGTNEEENENKNRFTIEMKKGKNYNRNNSSNFEIFHICFSFSNDDTLMEFHLYIYCIPNWRDFFLAVAQEWRILLKLWFLRICRYFKAFELLSFYFFGRKAIEKEIKYSNLFVLLTHNAQRTYSIVTSIEMRIRIHTIVLFTKMTMSSVCRIKWL